MLIPPIFDLPELLALIIPYLHARDIIQCIACSRGMSRAFEPFLYQHFHLARDLPNVSSALSRNRHHIRSIDIRLHSLFCVQTLTQGLPPESPTDKRLLCTNLQYMALADFPSKLTPVLLPYFTLLNSNDRLTYLQVPSQFLNITKPGVSFPITLSRLHHLQHLIVGRGDIPIQPALDFLSTALGLPRLKELYCKFSIRRGDISLPLAEQALNDFLTQCRLEDDQATMENDSIGRGGIQGKTTTGSKITGLQLPYVAQGDPQALLMPLLQLNHRFDLERFYTPCLGLMGRQQISRCRQILEELAPTRFSKVKHLFFPPVGVGRCHDPLAVLEMIHVCSGLRSFSGEWFCADDSFMEPLCIIDTLLDCHAETLEELEFPGCILLESVDLRAILTECRRLRRLWVWPDSFGQCMLEFVDASSEEWACSGLTELSLSLGRATRAFDEPIRASEEEEREIEHDLARQTYARIGRLDRLTALALGSDGGRHTAKDQKAFEWDLTVSRGWLTELAGLKRLKTLYLPSRNFWARMGQEEVEFMLAEWPELELIGLGGIEAEDVWEWKDLPHWRWLTRERPWLRLVYYSPKAEWASIRRNQL
ncbi:hypothetical protein EC968_009973 [Mortierella alpina]|nr:hypothetical protein EC968_009973 [Mortierella alpina]